MTFDPNKKPESVKSGVEVVGTEREQLNKFLERANDFLEHFNSFVSINNLNKIAVSDHMGYRCESHESFLQHREMFSKNSQYFYESTISNRRILSVKLLEPIKTVVGDIWFVELADQKLDGSQKEGFDHAEIVPKYTTFDEMKNSMQTMGIKMQETVRPHHTTYDIVVAKYSVKLSQEPLVQKIKRDEFI